MRGLPRSVRARITLLAVLLVSAVLLLTAVSTVVVQRNQLLDNLDRSLEQRADQIAAGAASGADDAFANSNTEDRFAQLLDSEGDVIGATDNVADVPLPVELDDGVQQSFRTTSQIPIEDDAYRVLTRRMVTPDGNVTMLVGENVDDARDSVRTLALTFAVLVPLAVALLGLVVWWLVGRTLKPVEDIRRQVADIRLDHLERRVSEPGTGDEIDRLASTMNTMLDRLQASSDRQQRFVADASHELRSPLTRMRSTLEVDMATGPAELLETSWRMLSETIELQELVDDLLFLARHDSNIALRRAQPVDLDVVVEAEVRRIRDDVEVTIDQSEVSAAAVDGDAAQLARAVRNLVANATRHAQARVAVHLEQRETAARLIVDDDGPGVPAADRERVFDRFTRLDDARSVASGGTGLGLAIASEIVKAHEGTIRVEEAPGGGARFVVELPAFE